MIFDLSIPRAWFKRRVGDSQRGLAVAVTLALAIVASTAAIAGEPSEPTMQFDIPKQRADVSLTLFAEQANVTLIMPFEVAQSVETNPLVGTFTVNAGIKQLLAGTILRPEFSEQGLLTNITDKPPVAEDDQMTKKPASLLAGLAALFVGSGSNAQQNDSDQGFALEEIVVTARKVEENLQDAPIAVSAFTGAGLQRRGFTDISSVARVTPNLVFDTAPPISGNSAGAAVFLRGVGQLDFTINVDPGVGVYIDGVYMSRSIGSVIDLVDIDRVEILRGPQGTLFGRNTIGGAIQLVTKRPGDEFGGRIKTIVGSDSRIDVQASLDVPLSPTLKSRFSVLSRQRDGYVIDGRGVDLGDDDTLGASAQFVWDASDSLSFRLSSDYSKDDENGAPNVPIELFAFDGDFGLVGGGPSPSGGDDFGTRFNFFAPNCPFDAVSVVSNLNCFGPQYETNDIERTNSNFPLTKSENDISGVSLTIDYSAPWADFKSITAVRNLEAEFARDSDHSPFPIFATANLQDQDQFTQEFQLSGSGERSKWVLGAYYFEEEAFEFTQIFLPAFGGPVLLNGLFYNDVDNDSNALYGEYTFDFTDRWSATFGARYSDESKSYATDQGFILVNGNADGSAVFAGFDPNDPTTNPEQLATFDIFDRAVATSGNPATGGYVVTLVDDPGQTADFSETTFRASLAYTPSDSTLLYGTFSDGFKSGGFNPRYLAPTSDGLAIAFEPEFVENFELGYKFSGDAFRANLALFATDYDNIQISADSPTSSGATVTQNAAAASIKGLEGEFTYVPNDQWMIEGGFGWLDAEYDELGSRVSSAVTLDSRFPRIPEFTANVGVSYLVNLSNGGLLTARLDGSYRGDTEGTVQNDSQAAEGSYALFGANVSYETPTGQWRFSGGVTNLTDEEYANSFNVNQRLGYAEAVFARGIQFFASAEFSFGAP